MLKTKGSYKYEELLRETMIWLLTRPFRGDDVIQCAIKHGAYEMLHEIVNTEDVFRFDESEHRYASKQFQSWLPYLREMVLSYDKWRDKKILEMQPMRQLTKPYFRVVQRCYFMLGLLQLIYMICFTHYHMPNTCSLVQLFNVSTSWSNCSTGSSSDWNQGVSRGSYQWLWLTWPVVLCAGNAWSIVLDIKWIYCKYNRNFRASPIHNAAHFCKNVLLATGQKFPTLSFCASVFVWYSR